MKSLVINFFFSIYERSPKTLLALEKARNEMMPGIIILIQKQIRGYICREQYKRMKAAHAIIKFYRWNNKL